jgi:hypothetical protein
MKLSRYAARVESTHKAICFPDQDSDVASGHTLEIFAVFEASVREAAYVS